MLNTQNMLLSLNSVVRNLFLFTNIIAYIDPNTGGMLFQVLVVLFGIITGLLLFLSSRLKGFFYKIRRKINRSDSAPIPETKQEEPLSDKE